MAQQQRIGSRGLSDRLLETVDIFHSQVSLLLKTIAVISATYPIWTATTVAILSMGFLGAGLNTNFFFETNNDNMWVPLGSYTLQHKDWIKKDSGFPQKERVFGFLIHRTDYESVLEVAAVERVFDVMETITGTAGFEAVCSIFDSGRCHEVSVASLWGGNREAFEETVTEGGLDAVIDVLSQMQLPSGERIVRSTIMGTPEPSLTGVKTIIANHTSEEIRLKSALSFRGNVFLPHLESESKNFEGDALERIFRLQDEWMADESNPFRLQVYTDRSFEDEMIRAITNDIPLMGFAILAMCFFCIIYFFKMDRVRSQCLLGVGAIVCILLALSASYGLMFCLGVPFTSLTQIFPFILLGVGLDDAFIITGSFVRTDHSKVFVDRIADVMEDSGITITVTTLTTFGAFLVGSITSIPAIRWFCWYAAAAILIDFLYQITFFVALMALDHRRQAANRYDVIACCTKTQQIVPNEQVNRKEVTERLMEKYAGFLLLPRTKAAVIVFFSSLLGVGGWLASHVTQKFDVLDLLPSDSYVDSYFGAFDETSTPESDRFLRGAIYFRDVDFSRPEIQAAMRKYVREIVDLEYITYPPDFFWLDDFDTFVSAENNGTEPNIFLRSLSFEHQVALFLETEPYRSTYSRDIVLNEDGIMTASRTHFAFDKVDLRSVNEQMDAFLSERAVTQAQGINQGKSEWPFFALAHLYPSWEFYVVAPHQLLVTTCVTLATVAMVAIGFIRHPAGSLFSTAAVAMVYVELLGVIYVAGLHINPVTSVTLIMSIGLAIDFCIHLVCKYFELNGNDKNKKMKEALQTLGKSVVVGGFSTFLGKLALSLSSSQIFRTFFVTFLGTVVLGLGHGLILVPVVLSIIGPDRRMEESSSREATDEEDPAAGTEVTQQA